MTVTPLAVVTQAFAAVESRDWRVVAELTHPRIAEDFRSKELAMMLAWADYVSKDAATRGNGFSSSGEINPELLARFGDKTLEWLSDRPTIGGLASLSPRDFLARWLRVIHEEAPLPRRRREVPPRQILGVVEETAELAHVVYRGVGWIPTVTVQLMSVSRVNGRWLLMQNMDILRMTHLPIPGRDDLC